MHTPLTPLHTHTQTQPHAMLTVGLEQDRVEHDAVLVEEAGLRFEEVGGGWKGWEGVEIGLTEGAAAVRERTPSAATPAAASARLAPLDPPASSSTNPTHRITWLLIFSLQYALSSIV